MSSKLTVNLGLRFDYNGVPIDAEGRWRTLDFVGEGSDVGRGGGYKAPDGATIPTLSPSDSRREWSGQAVQAGCEVFHASRRHSLPPEREVGFQNWRRDVRQHQPHEHLDHSEPDAAEVRQPHLHVGDRRLAHDDTVVGADGVTYQVQTRQYRAGQPVLSLNDPFLTKTGVAAVLRPTNLLHIRPNTKDGDVWKWNLDIQRELPSNMALTVAYVGSKGSHLGNSVGNFNQAPPSPNTDIQSRRPYQRFYDPALPERGVQALGNIRYLDSYGESFYHGLQMKLDRRFSKGLALGVAYTYSKAHGDGENGGQGRSRLSRPVGSAGQPRPLPL